MKHRIAIIDDSESDLRILKGALEEACRESGETVGISSYTSPEDALAACRSRQLQADLIFVDVMMPEIDGMTLIPELRRQLPASPLFVLISSNHGYIRAGYGVEAFDFLCKPFVTSELHEVLDRAFLKLRSLSAGCFSFHGGGADYKIDYSEILLMNSERNNVLIQTKSGIYSLRTTIKELHSKLPDFFVQCSRGTLLNMMNVSAISRTSASFRDSELRATISKQYFAAVFAAFTALN